MDLAYRGYKILTEEGLLLFIKKASKYVVNRVLQNVRDMYKGIYFKFKNDYDLTIEDVEVSFSAPNYAVVQRNRYGFRSEQSILIDLVQELESDDIFYDIGANIGLYSLFAAKKCSKVVSFEPYPPSSKMLKKDISHNNISNVKLYEIALSNSEGEMMFSQPDEEAIGHGSSSIVKEETEGTVEISTRAGDDLISEDNLSPPNVIKVDVEGSEPLVIDGLKQTLSNSDCRLIYIEIHLADADYRPSIQDFDSNLNDIKSQLRDFGFAIKEIENRGSEVFLKGYK